LPHRHISSTYILNTLQTQNSFFTIWQQYRETFKHELEKEEYERKLTTDQKTLLDEILQQVNDLGGEFSTANRNARIKRLNYRDMGFSRIIGNGKFGKVFQGSHFGRIVAVKQMIPEAMTRQSLMAFVAEIHMLSHISHNNIIDCVGAVLSFPHMCLITEYAKRGNLKQVLRTSHYLTWKTGKHKFLLDISAGMGYLHGMKNPIVHRDLKADNLLVTEDMTVKVTDFGLARAMKEKWNVKNKRERKVDNVHHKKDVGSKGGKENTEAERERRGKVLRGAKAASADGLYSVELLR